MHRVESMQEDRGNASSLAQALSRDRAIADHSPSLLFLRPNCQSQYESRKQ